MELPTINISFFSLIDNCLIFFSFARLLFFSHFICSCSLLITISFSVTCFFFNFLDFLRTIFPFHIILIEVMIAFQEFISLIKYCFYCFLFAFNLFFKISINFLVWNLMQTHNFQRVLSDSGKTSRKQCIFTDIPHQEIR